MDDSGDYETNEESPGEDVRDHDVDSDMFQHAADELLKHSPSKRNINDNHQTTKWLRLRRHYSDQYLELFNTTWAKVSDDKSFEDSQYGSVVWTASEKGAFFTALSIKGRHDLAGISSALPTKSVVEVKDYLDWLKDAHIERQMFADRTKNVSQAQIEAAVEVGEECEAMLDGAADALAAYQECYDKASACHQPDELWLIDIDTAEKLDTLSDETGNRQNDDEMPEKSSDQRPEHELFHLSKLLELSRKLFMNAPPGSEHMHWTQLADFDESPSIAVDAVDLFHKLVVNLVQRILQSAIFLAQSRIRAMTTSTYRPAHALQENDVEAALTILNMPLDAFDYWVKWVKRSKVNVVGGLKTKGQSDREKLSFRQIEEVLSIRAVRGRRRSLSNLLSMTSTDESSAGDGNMEGDVEGEEVLEEGSEMDQLPTTEHSNESDNTDTNDPQEAQDSDVHEGTGDVDPSSPAAEYPHVSRKRRLQMLENEEDEYAERLDQASRNREEVYLYRLLGQSSIKAESPSDPGWGPRGQRKTMEDLHDWTQAPYRSPWEDMVPSKPRDNSAVD